MIPGASVAITDVGITAAASVVTAAMVVFGTGVAIWNLRIIARRNALDAFNEFLKGRAATSDDRRFVRDEFVFDPLHPTDLPSSVEKHVRTVVNELNHVALLIERRIISTQLVFSICYVDIIRVGTRADPFIRHEQRIGSYPYGRRVLRLVERAKRYHDIKPENRTGEIRLYSRDRTELITIYVTDQRHGISGVLQRAGWGLRRLFRAY